MSRAVAHRPFAPGLLRQTTLELVRHPVDLAQPDRAAAPGEPSTQPPGQRDAALPSIRGASGPRASVLVAYVLLTPVIYERIAGVLSVV
jgi:hypothetical protein